MQLATTLVKLSSSIPDSDETNVGAPSPTTNPMSGPTVDKKAVSLRTEARCLAAGS